MRSGKRMVVLFSDNGESGSERRKRRRYRAKSKATGPESDSTLQGVQNNIASSQKMESSASGTNDNNIESINRSEELEIANMNYVNKMNGLSKTDSKLPALSGTAQAAKEEYEGNDSNPFSNFIAEYTKPTPVGQEPKTVQTIKQITWGAVIVLVLIEIYVSIKIGGSPIDPSKISVPSLPLPDVSGFKFFTGGAGPPTN